MPFFLSSHRLSECKLFSVSLSKWRKTCAHFEKPVTNKESRDKYKLDWSKGKCTFVAIGYGSNECVTFRLDKNYRSIRTNVIVELSKRFGRMVESN